MNSPQVYFVFCTGVPTVFALAKVFDLGGRMTFSDMEKVTPNGKLQWSFLLGSILRVNFKGLFTARESEQDQRTRKEDQRINDKHQ